MTEATYARHTSEQALVMLGELTDLYLETHSEESYHDDPLFSRSQFVERTENQAGHEGFELVTVRAGDVLAGFSFGLPFAAESWWAACTQPPEHILRATKFAVIELDVRRAYRGHGWGKALLNTLLSKRPEAYATLATIPESPAHAMYERWGWYKVAVFTDAPVMDAMVTELQAASLILRVADETM
jgi:GNAT superfamily N-acetyltransferase